MKIRIASSIALAAGLLLGASGCAMMAPQATLEKYAPSDGIDVNVGDIDLRNVLLIADESGENFNVVFSSVNNSGAPVDLTVSFEGENSKYATAEFNVPEGIAEFGNPEGEETPVLVTVGGLRAGATISANFQVAGASEVQYDVPVLDGTLPEYRAYVLPAGFADDADKDADDDDAAADAAENEAGTSAAGTESADAAASTETTTAE